MSKKNKIEKKSIWLNILCIVAPAFVAGVIAGSALVHFSRPEPLEKQQALEKRDALSRTRPLDQVVKRPGVLDQAMAHNTQGLIYLRSKQVKAAESEFERALQVCPNYDVALDNLSDTKLILGKYQEALSLIQRLSGVQKENEKTDMRNIYFLWSLDLVKQKKYGVAQNKLEYFLSLGPSTLEIQDAVIAYQKITNQYLLADDYENCVSLGKLLLRIVPYNEKKVRAMVHSNLAVSYCWLAEQTGQLDYLDPAKQHLIQAEALDENNPKIKAISEQYQKRIKEIEDKK